jgi:hypothetical protein
MKKHVSQNLKWRDVLVDVAICAQDEIKKRKLKNKIRFERDNLHWSFRDGGFWLRPIGIKCYKEIEEKYLQNFSQEKANEKIERLNKAIDDWNTQIACFVDAYRNSKEYHDYEKILFKKYNFKCKSCGSGDDLFVMTLISVSEMIARFIKETNCDIDDVDITSWDYFFRENEGLILCRNCYFSGTGDAQYHYHQMLIEGGNIEYEGNKQEYLIISNIQKEVQDKLKCPDVRNDWFLEKFKEIEGLECSYAESFHGRQGRADQKLKAAMLLRSGDYLNGKRLALRQQKYFFKQDEERKILDDKKLCDNFFIRNFEEIFINYVDNIVDLYKTGDYSIVYFECWGPAPDLDAIDLLRESENQVRRKKGVPLIGEGWITEMELYNLVKKLLPGEEVIHHCRPQWLERQEYDIYIPSKKVAIEYMGEQHYKPIDFFGGEESFEKIKMLDRRKLEKSKKNGVQVLYVRFDEKIDEVTLREKSDIFL